MNIPKQLFFEVQKQKGAIIWLLLAALTIISFTIMLLCYKDLEHLQSKFSKNEFLIIGGIISLMFIGLYFLFLNIKMVTKIDDKGIHFRYPPFKNKFDTVSLTEISSFEVSEYKPMKEYGGWGFKKMGKPHGKNTAYTISGKIALKIKLKSNIIILLGTQRKDALTYTLRKLMEHK